jgi:signal recognition particle subunit SEC65
MVIVRKCGVERILYVSDIDVKLLLSKYRRVLKERAVLESSSQPSYLELLFC